MHSHRSRAFSLTELLIVVAIITILAVVLFPLFANAKARAAQTSCASNLRQAGIALSLYVEAHGGEYPETKIGIRGRWPAMSPILGPDGGRGPDTILRCPRDRPEGRKYLAPPDSRFTISYAPTWLLWGGETGYDSWKELLARDPNPILLRCYFHDERIAQMMAKDPGERGDFHQGHGLALRKDGSVTFSNRPDHAPLIAAANGGIRSEYKRDFWFSASDVPCPDPICDGKDPEGMGDNAPRP